MIVRYSAPSLRGETEIDNQPKKFKQRIINKKGEMKHQLLSEQGEALIDCFENLQRTKARRLK